MKIVGLVSAYKEGALVQGAIRSLERVGLDHLLVYEGPAGEPLAEDVPESRYPDDVTVFHGRWRTDGRKRDAMLKEAQRRCNVSATATHASPEWLRDRGVPADEAGMGGVVWGVWLDGDEILINGEYLRDVLTSVSWNDLYDGTGTPTIHWPMRVVEADGSISVTTGRLFRVDQVQSIDISVSVVTNRLGVEEGWGNMPEDARLWIDLWMRAIDTGRMIAWPPLPCEPAIYHRSNLRHPLRRGLRLHEQEADELKKAGKL